MPAKTVAKCARCRADRQKCLPEGRQWPPQKCERCEKLNYPCSASTLPGESGPPDGQIQLLNKHDILLSFRFPEITTRYVMRLYIGETSNSPEQTESRKPSNEKLSKLPRFHRFMIENRPDKLSTIGHADLEERDASNATPLHRAVERKDREWMQWLIEKGANKNSQDENGYSPLHYAIRTMDDGTIAGYLLESGADISAIDRSGNTPLHSAASASNLAVLRVCIASARDRDIINISDSDGNTPLHHAADDDWVLPGRIQELVGAGANVHACNHRGQTPLHVAVEGQRSDNAEALLECKAQVNAIDKDGQTPLVCLLRSYGWYLDSTIGKYELSESCYDELPRLFCILISSGADVKIRDDEGASPLNAALYWYLKWSSKGAFEKDGKHSPPPRSSTKKFLEWTKKDATDAGAGRRTARLNLPVELEKIWRHTILAGLHNAETGAQDQ